MDGQRNGTEVVQIPKHNAGGYNRTLFPGLVSLPYATGGKYTVQGGRIKERRPHTVHLPCRYVKGPDSWKPYRRSSINFSTKV